MQHSRFSYSALALLSLPLLAACGYGDHRQGYYDGSPNPPAVSTTVEDALIDTNELLDVAPGGGAGAFFEYESGGIYHVTTACDVTEGTACLWDILITPLDGASLKSLAPYDLEQDDSLTFGATNQLRLIAYTGQDFDGFDFETEPGAAIQVDALLDEVPANRYLFWVGDGALRTGAPSNPINLVPSAD